MRITGGTWRGRTIRVPGSGVRPSQDLLRQGVFSALGAAVEGARVLDLFAGSGAYGLEALSRGAEAAAWVERDRRTFAVLRANVAALCGEATARARCRCGDAARLATLALPAGPCDILFADPPYEDTRRFGLLARTLRDWAASGLAAPEALAVFEQSARDPAAEVPGWTLLRDRPVGDSRWLLYRRAAP
jgi:16S rRNA (guanine966-N2)-methyltransferase